MTIVIVIKYTSPVVADEDTGLHAGRNELSSMLPLLLSVAVAASIPLQ